MTAALDWIIGLLADALDALTFRKEDPWATIRLDLEEGDLP